MLDRFVPVAGMLMSDHLPVPRERMVEAVHLAELRLADSRPSLVHRLASGSIDYVRSIIAPAPAPAACSDPAC